MDPSFFMGCGCVIIGVAAWSLTLWWLDDTPPTPSAMHPLDREPHIVTALGRDGRLNPARYERLPDYAAARMRQRELAGQGLDSVILHADTGRARLDLSAWMGPAGRF